MPEILIPESIEGAAVDALAAQFETQRLPTLWKDPAGLAEHIRGVRAILVRNQTRVTEGLLNAAKRLLVVGRAGVGLDNIDVDAADRLGIVVTYTPEQNSISAAELTVGLILALARGIPAATLDTTQGRWNRGLFLGVELYQKTLGIIGVGRIGYLTAKRAQAFGMRILVHDPFLTRDNFLVCDLNAELLELDDLLTRADFVSCHVPATPETHGLLDGRKLAGMKPTAYLINTSRGEVIVEDDLLEALKSGRIAGAALDVRAVEPPAASELELLPNVILTPHIAAFTREAQERVTRAVCEDVARVLSGEPARNPATRFAVPRR